ncbi:glycosyltransferase family 4 protein [Desulfofalx alkaliphila]|uniref:glycosyltransferase family 4 protein n=1 Tax=Desulfofalx alkaliphila TaxID=105483 RepID=UPI0004E28047|nr:glycosyltransferase family 4 protein [Desulfofalx alkaliphila]
MKKKNIWLWNHYATDMYQNRGGRHYWFAKNLIKNGYNTTIFCANVRHNTGDVIDIEEGIYSTDTRDNIPFVFIKTPKYKGNGKKRILNMISFYKNLFPVAKEYSKKHGKPDIILASSVHPLTLVAGIKIAKKFNIPCICEVRDLWPEAIFAFNKVKENSLLGKVLVSGEHWIYKKADALIFTKEGDTDYIKEKKWDLFQGGVINLKKAYYINNGVDLDAFIKSSNLNILDDPDLEAKKFNVVYVGAIRPVNDVGKILNVALRLKDHKDIQFLIYGDGDQRKMLEQRVMVEGLTNVKIKGFVNKRFIPYILSKSSVNILNYSQNQYNWARGNSSNKLFEYMASGKPIISTVKMGYSIIDKYKCGIEIENASGDDLARAILDIKEMPKTQYDQLGQNARVGAKEFDFKVLTKKLIQVIDCVTEENK